MIFQKRAKKNSTLEFHIGKETIDTVQEYTYLGADHLTFDRGGGVGWVILKKDFLQALVGRKKLHAAQM